MAKSIQIRIDDKTKMAADELFASLGLDLSTAIRMFLAAALRTNGLPFPVRRSPDAESLDAMEDVRLNRNLHGPYKTAQEAVAALLEEGDA
ncbi:MAG: type II toxin-antitoxin system RelB/DinJ family antitoxin [Spirochaetales bacterium]|jgi:DNA-damage-inducible protein J|nr:type II toxin-antitoxin system RelB/DinJ family antitoxin [Spirochaetales bacterium]